MSAGSKQVTDKEILHVFAVSPDPIVTAKELTYNLSITQQAINKRLKKLESEDKIASKKVGASAVVYWLTGKGKKELSDVEIQQSESEDSQ